VLEPNRNVLEPNLTVLLKIVFVREKSILRSCWNFEALFS